MAATSDVGRQPTRVAREAIARAVVQSSDVTRLVVTLLASLAFVGAHVSWSSVVPIAVLVPVVILSALILPMRHLKVSYAATLAIIGVLFAVGPNRPYGLRGLVVVVVMALMYLLASSRGRHGVSVFAGDRMLEDLKSSLHAIGDIPALPRGWRAERSFATAHEEAFSGDFDVAYLDEDGRSLELVLVDVSGKGQLAGTRSLALSGALAGLVGSTAPESLLDAANSYLGRVRWEEGFATAVHIALDLESGDFTIGSAGHPPAVQYDAGAGMWTEMEGGRGPALGLLPGASYPRIAGHMRPGDALLVYTDGVIEAPGADLADGVDWMLGIADKSLAFGWGGLTDKLVKHGRAGEDDDRGAVLIWRE